MTCLVHDWSLSNDELQWLVLHFIKFVHPAHLCTSLSLSPHLVLPPAGHYPSGFHPYPMAVWSYWQSWCVFLFHWVQKRRKFFLHCSQWSLFWLQTIFNFWRQRLSLFHKVLKAFLLPFHKHIQFLSICRNSYLYELHFHTDYSCVVSSMYTFFDK